MSPKVPEHFQPVIHMQKGPSHKKAVLDRMQPTLSCDSLNPSRHFAFGAQVMTVSLVETRRAASRHRRHARVYGHRTTAMYDMRASPPPPAPLPPPYLLLHIRPLRDYNSFESLRPLPPPATAYFPPEERSAKQKTQKEHTNTPRTDKKKNRKKGREKKDEVTQKTRGTKTPPRKHTENRARKYECQDPSRITTRPGVFEILQVGSGWAGSGGFKHIRSGRVKIRRESTREETTGACSR